MWKGVDALGNLLACWLAVPLQADFADSSVGLVKEKEERRGHPSTCAIFKGFHWFYSGVVGAGLDTAAWPKKQRWQKAAERTTPKRGFFLVLHWHISAVTYFRTYGGQSNPIHSAPSSPTSSCSSSSASASVTIMPSPSQAGSRSPS